VPKYSLCKQRTTRVDLQVQAVNPTRNDLCFQARMVAQQSHYEGFDYYCHFHCFSLSQKFSPQHE